MFKMQLFLVHLRLEHSEDLQRAVGSGDPDGSRLLNYFAPRCVRILPSAIHLSEGGN